MSSNHYIPKAGDRVKILDCWWAQTNGIVNKSGIVGEYHGSYWIVTVNNKDYAFESKEFIIDKEGNIRDILAQVDNISQDSPTTDSFDF